MPYYRVVSVLASLLLLAILAIPSPAPALQAANCLACHSAMKGRIQSQGGALIELNVDTDRFKSSVHGAFDCTVCHIRFGENPHAKPSADVPQPVLSVASKVSSKFRVDPVAGAACVLCHERTYQHVLSSVHGKNIIEKNETDGALCVDCHGSPHYITPSTSEDALIGRAHQVETCGKCHGDEKLLKKYNLEENVMHSFEKSFHGRKLHLGHTRAPACSSCHGAHDIKTKNDPESPVYGKNRLVTCGKCHEGANEKFIPAITHKPAGPIPHYAEKGLIILTMGVFAFIISHVILEAFSDIRDAVFRRKEEEEKE